MKVIKLLALVSILALVLVACSSGPSPSYRSPGSSGPFEATYVPGLSQPEVMILNRTDRRIHMYLSGPFKESLDIGPGEARTVSLVEGTYSYNVTADNVNPLNGMENFRKNYRYTWTFTIQ